MGKSYYIDCGDSRVYLSESPEEFAYLVDIVFLNTSLITKEDLDNLVGYLAIQYPNVILESYMDSSTYLMCIENPTVGNQ